MNYISSPINADESDIINMCRACLSNPGTWNISTPYEKDNLNIQEIFETYTDIQFSKEDGMPQSLCAQCLDSLLEVHKFITKCKTTDTILRILTNKWDLKIPSNCKVIFVEDKKGLEIAYDNSAESVPEEDDSNIQEVTDVVEEIIDSEHLQEVTDVFYEAEETIDDTDLLEVESNRSSEDEVIPEDVKEDVADSEANEDELDDKGDVLDKYNNGKCNICCKTFKKKSNIVEHMLVHSKEKPYYCSLCGKAFGARYSVYKHKLTVHSDEIEIFDCKICCKKFLSSDSLSRHNQMLHKRSTKFRRSMCPHCGYLSTTSREFRIHMFEEHPDAEEISLFTKKCEVCDRHFRTDSALQNHMSQHLEDRKFLCSMCGKQFKTKGSFQTHWVIHTGERPYRCEYCGKSFTQPGALKCHTNIHTGLKPYQCEVCGKGFKMSGQLSYHLLTHTGEKRHACPHCEKRFALKGNLRQHLAIHSNDRPYQCKLCTKTFKSSNNMRKHSKLHHPMDV